MTSDAFILEAVSGYKIPFITPPPSRRSLAEPALSFEEACCCDQEIVRLLNKGAIEKVESSSDQFLSTFFLIEKSSGGMRFILNLKK